MNYFYFYNYKLLHPSPLFQSNAIFFTRMWVDWDYYFLFIRFLAFVFSWTNTLLEGKILYINKVLKVNNYDKKNDTNEWYFQLSITLLNWSIYRFIFLL